MKNDLQVRTGIMSLEALMAHGMSTGEISDDLDKATIRHFFTPTDDTYGCSTYAREAFMPKGMVVIGKIHKKPHLTFLMKGTMVVTTEDGGTQRLTGPMSFVVPAGIKRVAYIEEDITIVNVHLTKETEEANLSKVEEEVISPSYEAMGLEEPDLVDFKKFLSTSKDIKTIE